MSTSKPGNNSGHKHHWLIQTKLAPPTQAASTLARPRLYQAVAQHHHYRLCIVKATAGYGKTTFLTQWHNALRAEGTATAWLSLDEADGNIENFFAYLIAALTSLPISLNNMSLNNPQPLLHQDMGHVSIRALVSMLLDEWQQFSSPCYLFLDDYHRAASAQVDEFLHTLISYAPPTIKIIIATRTYPGFDLEKLRSLDHIFTVEAEDLLFDAEDLLNVAEGSLPQQDIELLLQRTEGWPIACKMASYLFLNSTFDRRLITEFSGNTLQLSQYISEQMFNTLTNEQQQFLMLTSATERFTGELAANLDEALPTWPILEALEQKKLFLIPLDSQGRWYRYHQLFTEYLYEKLKRFKGKAIVDVHRNASRWLFEQGYIPEAAEQAIKAHDFYLAAQQLDAAGGWRLIFEGKLDFIRSFLSRIPTDILNESPRLLLALLMKLIREGRIRQASKHAYAFKLKSNDFSEWMGQPISEDIQVELLVIIEILLGMYTDAPTTEDKMQFLHTILQRIDPDDQILMSLVHECTMRQYLEQGQLAKAKSCFAELSGLALQDNPSSTYSFVYLCIDKAMMYLVQAKFNEAEIELGKAMAIVENHPTLDFNLRSAVSVFIAELAYLRNDLSQADNMLEAALNHLEKYDAGLIHYAPAFTAMAGIARVTGDKLIVMRVFERAIRVSDQRRLPRLKTLAGLLKIKYLLLNNEFEQALSDAEDLGLEHLVNHYPNERDLSVYLPDRATLVLARLALCAGTPARVIKLLQPLANTMEAEHRLLLLIEAYLLMALAHYDLGNRDACAQLVHKAAYLSMHENYKRVFIDEGASGLNIYKHTVGVYQQRDQNQYFIKFLKEVIKETAKEVRTTVSRSPGLAITNLEYEVIVELARGLSNKEIARTLGISEDTVKYRLKKVYKRWNVSSRDQAAKFAQETILN